jgi:hypothetical protein
MRATVLSPEQVKDLSKTFGREAPMESLPYKRFYHRMIPVADDLYDLHLAELEKQKDDGR